MGNILNKILAEGDMYQAQPSPYVVPIYPDMGEPDMRPPYVNPPNPAPVNPPGFNGSGVMRPSPSGFRKGSARPV